ncbi:MAG: D-alanyl-D-alanine carboxypeptidase/D-alanyl-D-alanine-endopeptidase [Campylobacterota bacterium]|nr:D-alanyl-D-alanine carboxypeptidase/D-alanyl-D-alanine-endopeptidase [Campylobacterota bacterium]
MMVRIWLLVILSSFLFGEVLPGFISNKINQYKFKKSELAIYIKETGKNRTIASLNIDKEMTPASVVKVYGAYAVLLELGYDYRWPTKFYYTGQLKDGIVTGDLVVKGYGDPELNTRDIPSIVSALKSKGIRKIKGNIIIDRSYFTVPKQDSSHFDKNIYSAYNAMPDAMMFNQHTSRFSIVPKNGRHQVQKSIPGESYRVSNTIKSVPGSCKGSRSWPSIKVDHSAETPTLMVSGKLSKHCKKRTHIYIVTKPYKEFYAALIQEMKRSGIAFSGQMKVRKVPAGAKKVYTHYSPSLEKIISTTSKKSNNLFARHLLLTLGAKIYGEPANLDKGRRAVVQILNRYRLLDTPKCHIDNGCGLSRVSKITARSMANVLDHAYKNYGTRWMKTLSIAGQDGTIKRRFRSTIVKNRAWMKTGTLKNVKNISGYVKSQSGKLYTVVIMVNSKRAKYLGAKLQNDVMKWLVKYRGSGVSGELDPLPEILKAKDDLWSDIDVGVPTSSYEKRSPEASSVKSYFVQVGSFSTSPDDRFLGKLRNSGFAYRIVKDQTLSKVMVGPYGKRADAVRALKTLQQQVKSAYVTQL